MTEREAADSHIPTAAATKKDAHTLPAGTHMDSASAAAGAAERGSLPCAIPRIAQYTNCEKSKKTAAYSIPVVCRKTTVF